MSKVRVLVGTRKGAFFLTSDGKRERWDVSGPHFAGWEIYHLKGSPVDPNRLYASQTSGWFGQVIQRSSDGGKTWETPGGEAPPRSDQAAPATCRWAKATNSCTMFCLPQPASPSRPTNGTTARSTHGSSSASGISSHRSLIPLTRFTPGLKTPHCSAQLTAGSRGTNYPDFADTVRVPTGSLGPAGCACIPSFSIRTTLSGSTSPFRLRVPSAATTRARPGSPSTADSSRHTFS